MITLKLPLKAKWYEMIESGEKTEEYRKIKGHWIRRIMKCRKWCGCEKYVNDNNLFRCISSRCGNLDNFAKIAGGITHVCFSYGYTKRRMTWEVKGITIGRGNHAWGAPEDEDVFIVKLGKRVIDNDDDR